MAKILIKNGRVWDGMRFFKADVLTEGSKIAQIGASISESADLTYDATGMTVSAGLVDLHAHFRGISSDKYGAPAEMICFPFGVTAAVDAGGEQGDRALLDALLPKNAVFAVIDIKNGQLDLVQAEERLARYGDKAIGVKLYYDTKVSQVWDISPLREARAYAHAKGLRVMVHSSHSPVPILGALGAGDILTHAFHGGENNAAEDDFESIKAAQKRGVVIDMGMAGHVHTDFAVFEKAIARGVVSDTISTDITKNSAYTRGGRYGITMCMSIARTLGMREEDVFRAVTVNPAKAMGKAEWGVLCVGGCANLAVLSENGSGFDLTDKAGKRITGKTEYQCELTVLNGQVVYAH